MKTFFALCLPVLFVVLLSPLARAQSRPAAPASPGYWNVETNLTTRDCTIVRFYNGQDRLVYEERLPRLCLDLSGHSRLCRRTGRQLNAALQQVLRAPAAGPAPDRLARQFGQNRRVQRVYAAR